MTNLPSHPLEPDSKELRRWIDLCADLVVEHLETLASRPAVNTDDAAAIRERFVEPAPEQGGDLGEILERLRPAIELGFNTAGPGYLAFIPGGGLPSAALADFVALSVNRYVGVATAAPALARIEQTAVEWLAAMMGYPPGAGGVLTSGGSLSNLIAMVTARAAKLPEDFLRGTLYVSEETHHSVAKAARFAGFPSANVRRVAVDDRFRMVPERLEEAIEADRERGMQPFLVVSSAGTTNTGAIDPLPAILPIARRHGLWVHADAAYGGFFRIVPGGEKLLPGLEECDSITVDPHKGLFIPYGTGGLLVKDPETLRRAHHEDAGYMQDVSSRGEQVNFSDISPELSRDFRGLRVWLPIMLHGLEAFRQGLQEKLELARWAWEELRQIPELEMLDEPQLSVVAFAWRGQGADADRKGEQLMERVNARRRVFLSSSTIAGRYVLRICILSFRTHRRDVEAAVRALREEVRVIAGSAPRKRS